MQITDKPVVLRSQLHQCLVSVTNVGRKKVAGATRWENVDGTGSDPCWTLARYCLKCGRKMNVRRLCAMAVDGNNLVMYDQNNFRCDTALCAWNQRWAVLRNSFIVILIDARFADMLFIRCEQEKSYCRSLRDAIGVRMEVEDEDSQV